MMRSRVTTWLGVSKALIIILAAVLILVNASDDDDPKVTAPSGTFQGSELSSPNEQPYFAFRGIPFAEPPVGDLRFRKPVAKAKLDDVYDATEFKPHCLQFNPLSQAFPVGQEDCLYLNIFTPANALGETKNLKKVFFYLHGGGNMNGFPEIYEPGELVSSQDIVVVTTSYRLAFLGFFTTESAAARGNFGLWDQVEALRWVKANIAAFGGDPDGITLSGESAGGIDAAALSISSVSSNLFSQALSMSGVLSPGMFGLITVNPTKATFQIARREKCLAEGQEDPMTEEEQEEMIDCLRKVPAVNLISPEGLDPIPQVGLVIDHDLFPEKLSELYADKKYMDAINFNKKSFMVSFCYNEGAVFELVNDMVLSTLPEEQRNAMAPDGMFLGTVGTFLTGVYGPVSQEVVGRVAEYYTKHHEISPTADFTADVVFHLPSLEFANASSIAFPPGESQVYMLRFVTFPRYLTGNIQGIAHGLDQLYLFDVDFEVVNKVIDYGVDPSKWTKEDDQLKEKFMALVGGFVKTGRPLVSPSAELPSGVPPFDPEEGRYLVFNLDPFVESNFLPERVRLWKEQIPAWIREFPLEADQTAQGSKDEL